MTLILCIVAAVWLVGLNLMGFGLVRAPEGYEDEDGFHLLWKNNRPDARDVACIWTHAGSSGAAFTPAMA